MDKESSGIYEKMRAQYDQLTPDQLLVALEMVTLKYASDKAKALPESERKGRSDKELWAVTSEVLATATVSSVQKLTAQYEAETAG